MGTAISELYTPGPGPVRAILGDLDTTVQQFTDDAIKAVVQMIVQSGQLPGYALSMDKNSIEPALATPKDYCVLMYRTSLTFVVPNGESYSYKTRALSERFGDRRLFIAELRTVLYDAEFGGMLASWSDFGTWLTGITGLNVFRHLTDMQTRAPVATATISVAGITIAGGGSQGSP